MLWYKHSRGGAAGFLVTVSGMVRKDPAKRLHKLIKKKYWLEKNREIRVTKEIVKLISLYLVINSEISNHDWVGQIKDLDNSID